MARHCFTQRMQETAKECLQSSTMSELESGKKGLYKCKLRFRGVTETVDVRANTWSQVEAIIAANFCGYEDLKLIDWRLV